jgi:glycosyltransferase involved in cell wall biosynthesis
MAPLISIVVPSYNHRSLVAEALDSIAAQRWQPLELVVVDDASTDGTTEEIARVLGKDPFLQRFERVEFQRNPVNRGAHQSINLGVEASRGEWIGILNSDDRYAPGRLEEVMDAARSSRTQLVFSGVRMIDPVGMEVTTSDPFAAGLHRLQMAISGHPTTGFALLKNNVAISTGNIFFRRTLFDRLGGFRRFRYCHDWDFALRALLITEPVYVPGMLYDYRLHAQNSFRQLRSVADTEATDVLRTYFSAVRAGLDENPLAPSPANWPGVFEAVMDTFNFWTYWRTAPGTV